MVADESKRVKVENMSDVQVGYVLSSSNIVRRFMPHVSMDISIGELRELSLQHGGDFLLKNYLRINDRELAKEFGITEDSYDHEYNWTQKEIDACLNDANCDVLLDALDFAPDGIVQSIKDRAIELEVSDRKKLDAIGKRTNCDLEAIIRNKHAYDDVDQEKKDEKPKRRRATSSTTKAATPRRRSTTKKEDA